MQAFKEAEAGAHQHGVGQLPSKVANHPRPIDKSLNFENLSTEDTLKGLEQQQGNNERYIPNNTRPNGLSRSQTGVSVERAQADFAELSKQLSNASQHNLRLSRKASRRSDFNVEKDLEKTGALSSEESEVMKEPFDLEQTLRGYREQDAQTGIKAKRIGVLWENLSVNGVGGEKSIVRTFPDAFIGFFNVPRIIMRLCGWRRKRREDFKILREFKGLARPGEMVLVLGR